MPTDPVSDEYRTGAGLRHTVIGHVDNSVREIITEALEILVNLFEYDAFTYVSDARHVLDHDPRGLVETDEANKMFIEMVAGIVHESGPTRE